MAKKKDPRLVKVETYLCCDCIYWGNKERPYSNWKMCDMWKSNTEPTSFCMYSHPRPRTEEQKNG